MKEGVSYARCTFFLMNFPCTIALLQRIASEGTPFFSKPIFRNLSILHLSTAPRFDSLICKSYIPYSCHDSNVTIRQTTLSAQPVRQSGCCSISIPCHPSRSARHTRSSSTPLPGSDIVHSVFLLYSFLKKFNPNYQTHV